MKNTKDSNIRIALTVSLKLALLKELECQQESTRHPVKIFSELGVDHGVVRADIVTVNGLLHGYEIKSDADTLSRLSKQAEAYNRVFDKMTLVVGEKHILNAIEIVPDWWGIILAKGSNEGAVVLSTIRKARKNPSQDKLSVSRLLWKNEALAALEKINKAKGMRSKRREIIYEKLSESLSLRDLLEIVKEEILVNREDWRSDQLLLRYDD